MTAKRDDLLRWMQKLADLEEAPAGMCRRPTERWSGLG